MGTIPRLSATAMLGSFSMALRHSSESAAAGAANAITNGDGTQMKRFGDASPAAL